ncbi:uncharacterized protein (TIGR02145 family) [Fibrobacter sp. UWR4]|uniref:FISUMP domain-containing protein n=1 Tax=Fibrobacter sp. UWR4 TaxID=1896218 RepID=UPI000D6D0E16|nr:FISUMP domain-containing protein [Fibrobacter sp. UWR4]PWJ53757.1 uncharacterized protein (TIGR02145 family) [Fibrobacter sp. UWR4]
MSILFSVLFIACGDDSKSSSADIDDDLEEISSSDYDEEYDSSASQDSTKSSSSVKDSSASSSSIDSLNVSSSSNGLSSSYIPPSTKDKFTLVDGIAIKKDTVSDRSINKIYKTIQIGNKIWLAENLQSESKQGVCYDKQDSNCINMGWLYRTDVPGCPGDFTYPTQEDWEYLFYIAKNMKSLRSKDLWDNAGTDEFGFNLLPAGTCDLDTCTGMYETTSLLCKDPLGSYTFTSTSGTPEYKKFHPSIYISVRCVMDAEDLYSEEDLPQGCKNRDRRTVQGNQFFECMDNSWYASTLETPVHCSDKEESTNVLYHGSMYNCRSNKWFAITTMDKEVGFCTEDKLGDTLTYKSSLYACDSLKWIYAEVRHVYGECLQIDRDSIYTFKGYSYVCIDSVWRKATQNEQKYGVCTEAKTGTFSDESKDLICKNHQWSIASRYDKLGVCNAKTKGILSTLDSVFYVCDSTSWVKAEVQHVYGECLEYERDSIYTLNKVRYVCLDSAWKKASTSEIAYGVCTKAKSGTFSDEDKTEICDQHKWRYSTLEDKIGPCTTKNSGEIKESNDRKYVCKDSSWKTASTTDLLGPCNDDTRYTTKTESSREYVCKSTGWTTISSREKEFGICTPEMEGVIKDNYYICKKEALHQHVWVASPPFFVDFRLN